MLRGYSIAFWNYPKVVYKAPRIGCSTSVYSLLLLCNLHIADPQYYPSCIPIQSRLSSHSSSPCNLGKNLLLLGLLNGQFITIVPCSDALPYMALAARAKRMDCDLMHSCWFCSSWDRQVQIDGMAWYFRERREGGQQRRDLKDRYNEVHAESLGLHTCWLQHAQTAKGASLP